MNQLFFKIVLFTTTFFSGVLFSSGEPKKGNWKFEKQMRKYNNWQIAQQKERTPENVLHQFLSGKCSVDHVDSQNRTIPEIIDGFISGDLEKPNWSEPVSETWTLKEMNKLSVDHIHYLLQNGLISPYLHLHNDTGQTLGTLDQLLKENFGKRYKTYEDTFDDLKLATLQKSPLESLHSFLCNDCYKSEMEVIGIQTIIEKLKAGEIDKAEWEYDPICKVKSLDTIAQFSVVDINWLLENNFIDRFVHDTCHQEQPCCWCEKKVRDTPLTRIIRTRWNEEGATEYWNYIDEKIAQQSQQRLVPAENNSGISFRDGILMGSITAGFCALLVFYLIKLNTRIVEGLLDANGIKINFYHQRSWLFRNMYLGYLLERVLSFPGRFTQISQQPLGTKSI